MSLMTGNIVKLKSGGELMTVDSVNSDGSVDCVWFEGKEFKSQNFLSEMLDCISQLDSADENSAKK